jgi:hypothetical protein
LWIKTGLKGTENGTKKPSAKPGTKGRWPKGKANRVPRVKFLNYLKKVTLFFPFERDILADGDVYFFCFHLAWGYFSIS